MIIYPQILGLVSSSVTIPFYRRKTQQNSDRALQKQQPQQPQNDLSSKIFAWFVRDVYYSKLGYCMIG